MSEEKLKITMEYGYKYRPSESVDEMIKRFEKDRCAVLWSNKRPRYTICKFLRWVCKGN